MVQVLNAMYAQKRLTNATVDVLDLERISLSLVVMELNAHARKALKAVSIMDLSVMDLALAQFFSHVLMDQSVYAMNVRKQLISVWIDVSSSAKKSLFLVVMEPNANVMKALKDASIMDLSVTDLAPVKLM